MLGRFLEFSLHAPDPGDSFAHYERLGFAAATAGDIWPHAYGVMCCEELALGLHGVAREPAVITFVQADVGRLRRSLDDSGIAVTRAMLGEEAFNQLELVDPAGVTLRVLEARSFSPPPETPTATLLGRFWRFSLPVVDELRVGAFWERLGFPVAQLGDTWPALATVGGLPVAWHSRGVCPEPVLLFRHADPAAAADRLAARGFVPDECRLPGVAAGTLQLRSPENLLALVLA